MVPDESEAPFVAAMGRRREGIRMPLDNPLTLAIFSAVALTVVVGVRIAVRRWLTARRRRTAAPPVSLEIDVEKLGVEGLREEGPTLKAYNVPVRLALVILAPVGRGSALPAGDRMHALADCMLPGLSRVLAADRPKIKLWPPQLSTQGFIAALAANVPLPGNRGKGTPWCLVAGKFEADDRAYLAGLVLRAAAPNNLSQITIERESQWLDVLRVDG